MEATQELEDFVRWIVANVHHYSNHEFYVTDTDSFMESLNFEELVDLYKRTTGQFTHYDTYIPNDRVRIRQDLKDYARLGGVYITPEMATMGGMILTVREAGNPQIVQWLTMKEDNHYWNNLMVEREL